MKHIFILNPAAGKGASTKSYLPSIISFVKSHGDGFEIHRSLNKQEIISYVKARSESGEQIRFYAVGGDGTICDVLNGMIGYPNTELTVIPCGTGNDFVKNFTHRENFCNLNKLLNGRAVPIDVIKYNNEYCINMLNIGTDCDVAARAAELKKNKGISGPASYAAAAMGFVSKGRTYDIEYKDDEGRIVREPFMLVAIGNGKYCGGGFKSCPKANLTDGLMDICFIRPYKGARLFGLMLKYHQGTLLSDPLAQKYVRYIRTPEYTLTPRQDVNVSVDGEIKEFCEAQLKVIPGAIKFVIPLGSDFIDK